MCPDTNFGWRFSITNSPDSITAVVTMPQGGLISGQAALINLNGTTPREMAVVPSVALVINFPRVARGFR